MYWFALFLVLYEFTTYSANDMIMPGMVQVVQDFHASEAYVALSLSAYLFGNCFFLLFAGILSERYGKRLIMLWGNLLFLFFTGIIIFSGTIQQFIVWRFFQGAGLAIISIGYALIHKHFNDKAAIKLIALMANISLLAPLLGPAIGSLIMFISSWEYIFLLTAILGVITLFGLYFTVPRDSIPKSTPNLLSLSKQYWLILKTKEFFLGMACSVCIIMPLLLWISQAPNLILYHLHLGYSQFVIYQLISVGGLSLSSMIMQVIAGTYRIYSIIKAGAIILVLGLLLAWLGSRHIEWIACGMLIYALGMGLANGCIWRLIMTIKGYPHSLLSSMLGLVQTLIFAIGISLANMYITAQHFSLQSFANSLLVSGLVGFVLILFYIPAYRNRAWL